MQVFNQELRNRDLMNPANGLIQPSRPEVVEYDPNPFQKYIQGYDVVGDYQLDNNKNNRKILQQIADRMDENKILDSSLMTADNDIIDQLIFEDLRDNKSNYMQLDATDYINEANQSIASFNKFRTQLSTQDHLINMLSVLTSPTSERAAAAPVAAPVAPVASATSVGNYVVDFSGLRNVVMNSPPRY